MLRAAKTPLFIVKRDIADYFASINHQLLLDKLAALVDPTDYLYCLLTQRVRFRFEQGGYQQTATIGIPFGTAIACLLANIYLTELDREVEREAGIHHFRYADDILVLSSGSERSCTSFAVARTSSWKISSFGSPRHSARMTIYS